MAIHNYFFETNPKKLRFFQQMRGFGEKSCMEYLPPSSKFSSLTIRKLLGQIAETFRLPVCRGVFPAQGESHELFLLLYRKSR